MEKHPDWAKLGAIILAATLGGGGISASLPRLVPDWYRPDPARGESLKAVEQRVFAIETAIHELDRTGPREVRAAQQQMLIWLAAIHHQIDDIPPCNE